MHATTDTTEIRCRLGALPEGLVRALRALDEENVAVVRYELELDGTLQTSRLLTTDADRASQVLEAEGFETERCLHAPDDLGPIDRWAFRFGQGVLDLERQLADR